MENKTYCTVKIKVAEGAIAPAYQTLGAAGADIFAFLPSDMKEMTILPGDFALVPTGISLEIPAGFEVQVRPRSGLAAKFGITVLNAPGTIDSDYRGEVKVVLINHSKNAFPIRSGDRIAQLVVSRVARAAFVETDLLSETMRGSGGFGSTGFRG